MTHFTFYDKQAILSLTKMRRFETKLGERVQVPGNMKELDASLRESSASHG